MVDVIKQMNAVTAKLLNTFVNKNCTDFKLSSYIISLKRKDGLLVFSTLSCALLLISNANNENDILEIAKNDDEIRKTLLLNHIIIPRDFDEMKFLPAEVLGKVKKAME